MQDKAGVFYAGPNKCFLKQDQTSVLMQVQTSGF